MKTAHVLSAIGRGIPGTGTIYIGQSDQSVFIGQCIYCGSADQLTDEHSIPYGLFGVATLKKASCRRCSLATQRIEQRVLRDTFKQVREFFGFPTRKSKRSGSWSWTRPVTDLRTGKRTTAPLDHGAVSLILPFPDYSPRALAGEVATEKHKTRAAAFIPVNQPKGWLPEHFEDGWIRFNAFDMERCIAKIALCEAIRLIDPAIRDPEVSSFIVNGSDDSSLFLGSKVPGVQNDQIHTVSFQLLKGNSGEAQALLANVRLFSFLPTPTFLVVLRPGAGWQAPNKFTASAAYTSPASGSRRRHPIA